MLVMVLMIMGLWMREDVKNEEDNAKNYEEEKAKNCGVFMPEEVLMKLGMKSENFH